MAVKEFAPAKINLTLHVTGQRDDGYHLLDSLVVFADVGDEVRAKPATELTLAVTGPTADGVPGDDSNLVIKAARLFDSPKGAALTLEKHLPAASGIGGGSSDAAATLRALSRLWAQEIPSGSAVLGLGADLPVCLHSAPVRMTGIGGDLSALPPLPRFWMVLVNPGVEISTPAVFTALPKKKNAPMPDLIPVFETADSFADWLAKQRNDLQAPAISTAGTIADVLERIGETKGCLLARMSGSGATCFGMFADKVGADKAAQSIAAIQPDWWVKSAGLRNG